MNPMTRIRTILTSSLLLTLVACGGESAAPALPKLPALDTTTLQASDDVRGRGWDGVVEAVQRADLTAQTTGRVTAAVPYTPLTPPTNREEQVLEGVGVVTIARR